MAEWQNYTDVKEQHTVVGNMKWCGDFYSPELDNHRDVMVYLPPSYESSLERRYPVIYMHDGQNVFDSYTSFVGEWQADETMEKLAGEGLEAIIVAPYHLDRWKEYAPYPLTSRNQTVAQGAEYMRFLVETLRPVINADFRTLTDKMNTGLAGSSMGGMISTYGIFSYPDVFGLVGIFSPAMSLDGGQTMEWLRQQAYVEGRLYLDMGTHEGYNLTDDPAEQRRLSEVCVRDIEQMKSILRRKGYRDDTMRVIVEHDALHNEEAWARRLPGALRFLLKSS